MTYYKTEPEEGIVILKDAETHESRFLLVNWRHSWMAYQEPEREWRMERKTLGGMLSEFEDFGVTFVDPPGAVRATPPGIQEQPQNYLIDHELLQVEPESQSEGLGQEAGPVPS